ncbi:MAG: hypothetical protein LC623_06915 [Halobacteriales archaeon]|nr:hypothetical protein [Halobacteriales archaeon]
MLSRATPLLLFLASAALSGCSGAPADSTAPGTTLPPSASGTVAPPPLPSGLSMPTNGTLPRLELTNCTAFQGQSQPFPSGSAPGEAPPGWEPDSAPAQSSVFLDGYECRRIHLGPLERGPLRLLVESHNHANMQQPCLDAAQQTDATIVHLVLVNDTALAALLHDRFGLPAVHAQISAAALGADLSTTPLDVRLEQMAWAWSTAGNATSTLNFTAAPLTEPYASSTRLFWQRGSGLGRLDIAYPVQDGPVLTDPEAYGTMQPPMLLASQPGGLFAGTAKSFSALSGEGTFRLYADTLCKSLEASS